jgi:choline dehydrogenase-like flavoprotein
VGACRFGDDPQDERARLQQPAHDLENRDVFDASFLPSGGINPRLTIAADSLRATDKIAQRL